MRANRIETASRVVLLLALSWPTAGCTSDDDEIKPSPIPPGYAMLVRQRGGVEPTAERPTASGGDTLDEMLAVVDRKYLTRREVLRRLRLNENRRPGRDQEQEIRQARIQWAQQQIINAIARRAGLSIPASFIDERTRMELERQRKVFEEESGVRISQHDYLKERRITWAEFREQMQDAIIYQYYMTKLLQGAGQEARPEVDFEVSPAEVRRIYFDHKQEFDVKRGAKFMLLQMRTERFETEGRDFLDAEDLARRYAEQIASEFRGGASPDALVARYKVSADDWTKTPEFLAEVPDPAHNAWVFAPERRARDATVFSPPGGRGPIVIGILEIRAARARTLEEVYEDIVVLVQKGKQFRLEAQLVIDEVQRGGTVWPEELADELLDQAHAILDEIEANEVLGGARLK